MTTAAPSGFNPTGVWLDHHLGPDEPPLQLFLRFASEGGPGVILDGSAIGLEMVVKSVELVKELGLQAMMTVSYHDLAHATTTEVDRKPLEWIIRPADAVLISLRTGNFPSADSVFPVEQPQEAYLQSSGAFGPPELFEAPRGDLPEKPWIIGLSADGVAPSAAREVYKGPFQGFLLNPPMTHGDSTLSAFPSLQNLKETLNRLSKDLDSLRPAFYSFPFAEFPGEDANTVAQAMNGFVPTLRELGFQTLVMDSRQYADLPELRDLVGLLSQVPDDVPSPGQRVQQPLITLIGHTSAVLSVAVTPDGRHAVSAGYDEYIIVWDLASRKEPWTLRGHEDTVESVVVTPDGKKIVSGSADETIRIWDLETGKI